MRAMKEKLEKNHYKGFDKKAKIFSCASISLLFIAVCTFVPLTALEEAKSNNIEATKTQEKTNDNTNNSSAKGRAIVSYSI